MYKDLDGREKHDWQLLFESCQIKIRIRQSLLFRIADQVVVAVDNTYMVFAVGVEPLGTFFPLRFREFFFSAIHQFSHFINAFGHDFRKVMSLA